MRIERRNRVFTWMFICIVFYLVNAMLKYFLPGNLTKILPVASLSLALFMTLKERRYKLKLNTMEYFLLGFIAIWFFGCLYSSDMAKGMGFVFSLAVAVILQLLLREKDFNERDTMRIISIISAGLSIAVIHQSIDPKSILEITKKFNYTLIQYEDIEAWMKNGWYCGLFPDRAPAAFFGALLAGTGMYYMFSRKQRFSMIYNKIFGIVFYILGVYSILLTAKRGLLVGCFVSTFCTYIIYKRARRNSVLHICVFAAALVAMAWLIISNLEAAKVILERFNDNGDFYTGRIDIYNNIREVIAENFIFGTGTASAYNILGIGGHNIYLTLCMENGIFAVIVFIFMLLNGFVTSVKNAFEVYRVGQSELLAIQMFSVYIQIFFIIYGFSGNPLYDNYILYFYVFSVFITGNTRYKLNKYKGEKR